MEKRRRVGAYGIARDEQGRVLLVRSSARSNVPGKVYLPGGGLEHGENPYDGVRREFLEETGLEIEVSGLRQVRADLVEFPWRDVLLHHDRIVFDVNIVGGRLTAETDGTSDLPMWVAPADLPDLDLIPFAAEILGVRPLAGAIGGEVVDVHPDQHDEAGEMQGSGRALTGEDRMMRFGAYGVVTDPSGRVLLSLISDNYPGAGHWHLPGGGTDFGEQPGEGLRREIFEESGQVAEVLQPLWVGSSHNPQAMGPEGVPFDWYTVRVAFRAIVSNPTVPSVTEAAGGSTAEARWFSPEELSSVNLSDLARKQLIDLDAISQSGRLVS